MWRPEKTIDCCVPVYRRNPHLLSRPGKFAAAPWDNLGARRSGAQREIITEQKNRSW
jgi:hypothetical protein